MRDANRLVEMETFLAVVDEGSFSGAAAARGLSPSAVSKMMARLEVRLNTPLIRRTTRRLQITDEGIRFAQSARDILSRLDQAEREAGCGLVAGTVRIATSAAYANHILAPILPELAHQFPDLEIELIIGDSVTDLSGKPVDLAVRAGPLPDSSLRAQSLGQADIIDVTSPGATGPAIGFAYVRRDPLWQIQRPRIRASDGNTIAVLAAHGCGTARVARFVVANLLANGRLQQIPGTKVGTEEFHVIYLGTARALPARIAAVIQHLVTKGRVE